jgi:hypothetical protein
LVVQAWPSAPSVTQDPPLLSAIRVADRLASDQLVRVFTQTTGSAVQIDRDPLSARRSGREILSRLLRCPENRSLLGLDEGTFSQPRSRRADQLVQVDPMRIVRSDIRASKTDSLRVERCQPGAKNHLSECTANLLRVDCGDAAAPACWRASWFTNTRSVSSLESQSRIVRLGGSSRSPAAPSITNANVLRLGAIYPRFDGCRVASGASTPSHHRPSRNGRLWNDRSGVHLR